MINNLLARYFKWRADQHFQTWQRTMNVHDALSWKIDFALYRWFRHKCPAYLATVMREVNEQAREVSR